MNFESIEIGLVVSAIGLGFVFLVLFILTFSIFLLGKIEGLSEKRKVINLDNDKEDDFNKKESNLNKQEINMAAAAALVLALEGKELEMTKVLSTKMENSNSWSSYGRIRLFFSRLGTKK